MVYVLDKNKKPLMPCSEKRARQLLDRKRAVVHKMCPFTIRLKERTLAESSTRPLQLKLDPGSKTTGFAVLREDTHDQATAILLGELSHKPGIKEKLDTRRALRRSRRSRKTRYRKPRFNNRKPAKCVACGKNAKSGSRYCSPCARKRNFVDNGHRDTLLAPSLKTVDFIYFGTCECIKALRIPGIKGIRSEPALAKFEKINIFLGGTYQPDHEHGY